MDQLTQMILIIGLLLFAGGLMYGVYLYFEKTKPKRIKQAKRQGRLDKEDEAYNSVMSTKSIANIMKKNGEDVTSAEITLERAEMALDAENYTRAKTLADEARDKLDSIREEGVIYSSTPTSSANKKAYTLEDIEDAPPSEEDMDEKTRELEEQKERLERLPENYMESQFEIEVARDMVKREGDEESRRLLRMAENKFEEGDYTGALSYSIKCKRCIDEDKAGLLAGQTIGKKKKETIVEETPGTGTLKKETVITEKRLDKTGGEYYCQECGNPVSREDKFCNKCGAKVEITEKCPECGDEIDPDDNFCSECGYEVKVTTFECPECGKELQGDVKFCPKCGVEFEE